MRNFIYDQLNSNIFEKNKLYLLKAFNHETGFFAYNDKLVFMIKNNRGVDKDNIETNELTLNCNVYVYSVENAKTFESGHYNLLFYNDSKEAETFDVFVDLCESYVESESQVGFINFFYSLINLFQMPKKNIYTNLIGLFGELEFILLMKEKHSIDISNNWHVIDTTDKYDFVFEKFNAEIKTSVKLENNFKIKHNQVFNEKRVFICLISLENDNSGKSLIELIDHLRTHEPFSKNLNFQINLQREFLKINTKESRSLKFSLKNIKIYLNKEIDCIVKIPEAITNLNYDYNFEGQKNTDIKKFIEHIQS